MAALLQASKDRLNHIKDNVKSFLEELGSKFHAAGLKDSDKVSVKSVSVDDKGSASITRKNR